jgi:hypothetical protein
MEAPIFIPLTIPTFILIPFSLAYLTFVVFLTIKFLFDYSVYPRSSYVTVVTLGMFGFHLCAMVNKPLYTTRIVIGSQLIQVSYSTRLRQ